MTEAIPPRSHAGSPADTDHPPRGKSAPVSNEHARRVKLFTEEDVTRVYKKTSAVLGTRDQDAGMEEAAGARRSRDEAGAESAAEAGTR
ncbi:hypothetical protein AGOR_G00237980 [Albula goreensis]|uniref:Uncharacterized protein n=1 Tax=Albula goreensis TaxID=1534307 RepID=A0A8T3CCT6_9TELE|nr:hypothetical protein AGOR_G00237980 [Albula goreensis]